jgi:hypothetical protein
MREPVTGTVTLSHKFPGPWWIFVASTFAIFFSFSLRSHSRVPVIPAEAGIY